jgi:oligoendopeptidase F
MITNKFINSIILHHSSQFSSNFNEHWNIGIKNKLKFASFSSYIKFIKLVQHIAKQYYKIYNWLYRRLFINKSIKLVEYYYRPNNPGYLLALNNFNKNVKNHKRY